jgi:hypothetical protein
MVSLSQFGKVAVLGKILIFAPGLIYRVWTESETLLISAKIMNRTIACRPDAAQSAHRCAV